jgi:hypothetical protein
MKQFTFISLGLLTTDDVEIVDGGAQTNLRGDRRRTRFKLVR